MELNKLDELFDQYSELAYGSYCQYVTIDDEDFDILVKLSEHCDRHTWEQKTREQRHEFLDSLIAQEVENIKRNNEPT